MPFYCLAGLSRIQVAPSDSELHPVTLQGVPVPFCRKLWVCTRGTSIGKMKRFCVMCTLKPKRPFSRVCSCKRVLLLWVLSVAFLNSP